MRKIDFLRMVEEYRHIDGSSVGDAIDNAYYWVCAQEDVACRLLPWREAEQYWKTAQFAFELGVKMRKVH